MLRRESRYQDRGCRCDQHLRGLLLNSGNDQASCITRLTCFTATLQPRQENITLEGQGEASMPLTIARKRRTIAVAHATSGCSGVSKLPSKSQKGSCSDSIRVVSFSQPSRCEAQLTILGSRPSFLGHAGLIRLLDYFMSSTCQQTRLNRSLSTSAKVQHGCMAIELCTTEVYSSARCCVRRSV